MTVARQCCLAACLGLAVTGPAAAQDAAMQTGFATSNAAMTGIANTAAMNSVLRNAYGRPGAAERRGRALPVAARSGPQAASFAYDATPALARDALDGYIARASRTEPDGARQLAEQLGRNDYRKIYRGLIAGTGLRDDDAVDALTAYTVLGWLIVHDVPGRPDTRGVQALRADLAAKAARNPNFAAGRRGALGEEFKLLFVTLHAGWQSARREGNARQYGEGVAAMFKRQSNLDLRALDLTPEGFAPR